MGVRVAPRPTMSAKLSDETPSLGAPAVFSRKRYGIDAAERGLGITPGTPDQVDAEWASDHARQSENPASARWRSSVQQATPAEPS